MTMLFITVAGWATVMAALWMIMNHLKNLPEPLPPNAEANRLMAKNKELLKLYQDELNHSMQLEKMLRVKQVYGGAPTLSDKQIQVIQDEMHRLREENRLYTEQQRYSGPTS